MKCHFQVDQKNGSFFVHDHIDFHGNFLLAYEVSDKRWKLIAKLIALVEEHNEDDYVTNFKWKRNDEIVLTVKSKELMWKK